MPKGSSLFGRAVLAVVMMVGFYLLAFGICAALGTLMWMDAQSRHVHPKLWIVAAITIGVVVWSVFPRALKFPDPGIPLGEQDQPQLWRLVREVATAAGQQPPKKLFLVGDVNAFVAERGSRMGFGGERLMGIGLPLLQVLTVSQLRSVVAHEFGHFHGGDTRLGPFIYRTRDAIGRTVMNFQRAESLLQKPFEWYGHLFLRVTFAISRAQEFAADALAVRLCGLEPVQTALRRVNEVGPLFDHYLESEFLPVLNQKRRPPLAGGFATFLASSAMKKLSLAVGEQAMQAKGNPYDSHPPLSERLAAAAAVDGAAASRAAGPLAITLLQSVDAVEAKLLRFQTGADEVAKLPAASWDDVCAPAVAAGWAAFAQQVANKLPELRLVDLVGVDQRFANLALQVDRNIPAAERPAAGAWMVATLLGHALIRRGFRVETGLGEPVVLVHGDDRLDPRELVRALAEGKFDAAWWRDLCQRHGIADLVFAGPAAA